MKGGRERELDIVPSNPFCTEQKKKKKKKKKTEREEKSPLNVTLVIIITT